jgi:hypothetical protein
MSDSANIDVALVAALASDAALMAVATGGVFFDFAAPGAQRFIVVSVVIAFDELVFNARSYEDVVYRVKYVEMGTGSAGSSAAAARIDALLDGKTLAITGYTFMNMERTEYVRYIEPDPVDASLRWQHAGGLYRVWASL